MPRHTTKTRTTANLKTIKQPELPESQTVWKYNNQGVKEETFIQTGRRDGDGQPGWRGHGKVAAGGPDEVAAGGPDEAAAGGPGWAR